jgi:hypothetical protein
LRGTKILTLTFDWIVALTSQSVPRWSFSLFRVEHDDVGRKGQVGVILSHSVWNSEEATQQKLFLKTQRGAEVFF